MPSTLRDSLLQASEHVVERWFRRVLASYPADTAKFLANHTASFQNPVGQTLFSSLEKVYAGLVGGAEPAQLFAHLDAIIRVRAVQHFTAAEAVAFVTELKPIVRAEAAPGGAEDDRELRALEDRIDGAQLMAFDIYMDCREQIFRIKSGERTRRATVRSVHEPATAPDCRRAGSAPCVPEPKSSQKGSRR
jgi:hypothetical protein